jgi:CheY-like chemotaxis protein
VSSVTEGAITGCTFTVELPLHRISPTDHPVLSGSSIDNADPIHHLATAAEDQEVLVVHTLGNILTADFHLRKLRLREGHPPTGGALAPLPEYSMQDFNGRDMLEIHCHSEDDQESFSEFDNKNCLNAHYNNSIMIFDDEKSSTRSQDLISITTLKKKRKPNILIVDPDKINFKMISRMISTFTNTVKEANNAAAALSIISESLKHGMNSLDSIEVILLNYMLNNESTTTVTTTTDSSHNDMNANVNGPKTAEQLRLLGFTGTIIGVMEGKLEAVHEASFKVYGADKVMTKPLNIEELEEYLQGEQWKEIQGIA